MKKIMKMKMIMIGFILGAGLMFAVQAGAATIIGSKVSSTMDVKLNGKNIGSAIVVNNSSYLPVRKLAAALDIAVAVDEGGISLADQELQKMKDEAEYKDTTFNNLNSTRYNLKQKIDRLNSSINASNNHITEEQTNIANATSQGQKDVAQMNIDTWSNYLVGYQIELAELQPQFDIADKNLKDFLLTHPEYTKSVNN